MTVETMAVVAQISVVAAIILSLAVRASAEVVEEVAASPEAGLAQEEAVVGVAALEAAWAAQPWGLAAEVVEEVMAQALSAY